MPTVKLCGLCDHFERIEGLFGKCGADMRKDCDNEIFSSDVGCIEWENPLFRKKRPKRTPRKIIKVIDFNEEKAKREVGK